VSASNLGEKLHAAHTWHLQVGDDRIESLAL
jgi:hypothetical protein